jgi:hypothetical protein
MLATLTGFEPVLPPKGTLIQDFSGVFLVWILMGKPGGTFITAGEPAFRLMYAETNAEKCPRSVQAVRKAGCRLAL